MAMRMGLWIVVVTLLVWVAFRLADQPLDSGATAVVALIVAVLLIGVQGLRSWWRGKPQ